MEKIEILSIYLECEEDEISKGYDECTFEHGKQEYLVLTEEEADERCKNYLLDTLWAFNTSFLTNYISCGNKYEDKDLEKSLVTLQELCETSNVVIKLLVGNRIDELIEDTISTNGRGVFLASYDGEEIEESDYYIYRTN